MIFTSRARRDQAALTIFPERRHREQTFICIVLPSLRAFTL